MPVGAGGSAAGFGTGAGADAQWQPDRDDHCYRHRDRLSFVLCQRCGRTVCGDCQTAAPVGVICPECLRGDQRSAPRRRPLRRGTATMWVIGVTVAVTAVQLALGFILGRDLLGGALDFAAIYVHLGGGHFEPWRLVSYALVHGSLMHLAFNMLALWFFGRAIEAAVGARRFLLLYVTSVLAGAAAVAILAPYSAVLGASGGVFGLMAASFFVLRRNGESPRTLIALVGINLAFGFFASGVSWQAHVGGLLAGAIAGWALVRDADRSSGSARGAGAAEIAVWVLAGVLLTAPLLVTSLYTVGASV